MKNYIKYQFLNKNGKILSLAYLFFTLLLIVAGILYYKVRENEIIEDIENELILLNDYKAFEINQWFSDSFINAEIAINNPVVIDKIDEFLSVKSNSLLKNNLTTLFEKIRGNHSLRSITLIDSHENIILSVPLAVIQFDGHKTAYVKSVLTQKQKIFTDLYVCSIDSSVHMTTYIPLTRLINGKDSLLALVVIEVNPDASLFPLIQSTPKFFKSLESLLVKKDSTDVVFLNNLRFKENSPLNFRLPISTSDLPAALAINGKFGLITGYDYRNEEVYAIAQKIESLNWFLITKIDEQEVLNPLFEKGLWIASVILILLVAVGLALYSYSRKVKADTYKKLLELEIKRKVLINHYESFIKNANDMIFLMDPSGNIIEANKKAVDTYGYTLDEMKNMNFKNLLSDHSINGFEFEIDKTRTIGGNLFEAFHKTKLGNTFPVEVSSRFIIVDNHNFVQNIIRDVSDRKYAEEKIKQTNKLLEAIISGTKDAVFIKDLEGKYILVNESAAGFVGKSANEIIGKDDSELFSDGTADIVFENDRMVLNNGLTLRTEETLISDGIKRTYDVIKYPWKDSSVNIIGLIGISRDSTEKYDMINKIKESEIRFKSLIENAPTAIAISRDMKFVYANPVFLKLYGYANLEELIGQPLTVAVSSKSALDFVNRAKNREKGLYAENEYEALALKKDGSEFYVHAAVTRINLNDGPATLGFFTDITQRKKAEEALKTSDRIFNHSIDMLCLAGFDGYFKVLNPAWSKTLGWSTEELLSKPWNDFIHPDDVEFTNNIKSVIVDGKEIYQFENRYICKDGSVKWLSWNSFPYPEEKVMFGVARDITDKKLLEIELIESEKRYKNIFNNNPLPMWVYDIDTLKFLMVNDAAVDHYGYSRDEFLNMTLKDIRPPEDVEKLLEYVKSTKEQLTHGIDHAGAWRHFKKDGTLINVEITSHPIHYDYHNAELVLANDITQLLIAENNLIESEKRYRRFFEEDLTGDFKTTPGGEFLMCNDAFVKILRCGSIQETMKKNVSEFYLNPEQRQNLLSELQSKRKLELYEISLRAGDGSIVNVLINVIGTFDNNGELIEINGYMFDITELKNTQLALQINEERMRSIVEGTPYLFFYTQDTDANMTYVSPTVEQMTGYSVDKWLKTRDWFITESSINQYAKERTHAHLRGELTEGSILVEIRHADGKILTLEVFENPIILDGAVIGLQGVAHDITDRLLSEKQLADTQKHFREVVEQAVEIIFTTDEKGNFTYANPAGLHASGYTLEELLQKNYLDLMHPEYKSKIARAYLLQYKNKNNNIYTEYPFYTKSGEVKWFGQNTRLIVENNEVKGFYVIARDITERRKAEESLKESEERYRFLAENIVDVVWILDLQNMKFNYVSPSVLKLRGYTPEEVLTQNLEQVLVPKSLKLIQELLPIRIGNYLKNNYDLPQVTEVDQPCKDGSIITTEVMTTIFGNKISGLKVLGVSRNITERKKAEKQIKLLSRSVEESPVAVVITDPDGIIEYVNHKFTSLTGYSFDEAKGQNPKILQSGFTPAHVYETMWNTLSKGEVWKGEFINKTKSGDIYYESATIVPIKNGHISHYVALKEDITERKKMVEELIGAKEKAEESDNLKSEFLAQVSHEIRTPLNVMLSCANLLKDELEELDLTDEIFKESITGIKSSGKRIIRTIDLILNMSQIQTGKYTITPKRLSLSEDLLVHSKRELLNLAKDKNLGFTIVNNTHDDFVICDEYSVSQIFINLIDNAIKYTQHGYIKVEISRNSNTALIVKVEDSGIGISNEYLPNLFKPFSQEEQGYSRAYEGNGLGLALVKKYCEINGIEISVESQKGKGTAFKLVFPVSD